MLLAQLILIDMVLDACTQHDCHSRCFYQPDNDYFVSETVQTLLSAYLSSFSLMLMHQFLCNQLRLLLPLKDSGLPVFFQDFRMLVNVLLVSRNYFSVMSVRQTLFPSSRHHLSYDDCLEDKRENYHNCFVTCCVRQLYTVIRTRI